MTKSESKYFNTAVRMDEAFIALLEQKELDFITVKEICAAAGVNRSTFYLHYETISDLLQESIAYCSQKCFAGFAAGDLAGKIDACSDEELIFVTPEFLVPYLEFVRDNKTLFKAFVTRAATLNADATFARLFQTVIAPILRRFRYDPDEMEYVSAFYINGIIAVVMEWVKQDCRDEIQAIVDIIIKVTVPAAADADAHEQARRYLARKTAQSKP